MNKEKISKSTACFKMRHYDVIAKPYFNFSVFLVLGGSI